MTCVQYNAPPPNRVVGNEAIQRGAFTSCSPRPVQNLFHADPQLNPTIGRCAYFLHADPQLNSVRQLSDQGWRVYNKQTPPPNTASETKQRWKWKQDEKDEKEEAVVEGTYGT